MGTLVRVFIYLRRYPWLATATLVCAVLSTMMVVVFPVVTQIVIDDVIRGQQPQLLFPMVLIALGAFFLQDFFNSLRLLLNNTFEQKVIFDLRSDLYGHMQHLPLHWFDHRATGDLMTRVAEDVTSMERVLIDGIEQGVVAVLQILIVLAVLLYQDWSLALIALLPLPLLLSGALAYTLTAHRRYQRVRRATSEMNSLLHDNLAGIRQIKSYCREEPEHERFNQGSSKVRNETLKVMRIWALYSPSMNFLNSLGLVLVIGFGGRAVLDGNMQIGQLVAFLALVKFLYDPIGRLHQLNQLLQSGRAAGERVFAILDEEPEPDGCGGVETPPQRGEVRYEHVHFAYKEGGPVLKDIHFEAPCRTTTALVGATGAGKTTLVSLMSGFYRFQSGQVYLDGRPLTDYTKTALRGAVGMVTQESFLFNGTVRENLVFAKPSATDEELWAALRAANAEGFVQRLPDQLESRVGERGVRLSVGEKQRLSIARVLLKDPPILVLDEATASVDTETERMIQEALSHLMATRTCFVIAHRLSTVVRADQILVMEHGRIVERGTHEELLAHKGLYAQLCQSSLLDGTLAPEPEEVG